MNAMKVQDLDFEYPEDLVATHPQRPSRVMWVGVDGSPEELTLSELVKRIQPGDVLVLNNTRVLKRRVFAGDLEILFLCQKATRRWEVLFPSRKFKINDTILLPEGVSMRLLEKGRPQIVEVDRDLAEDYFERIAELPLPPYIQKARDERHNIAGDQAWYQTAWAQKPGSFAAPTASLHFSTEDICQLKARGVEVVEVTLHVGLGTFLPVTADDLDQHDMHEEYVEIESLVWQRIQEKRSQGHVVWALGTTTTRSIESAALGLLGQDEQGNWRGFTKLLIQPGYKFQVVDNLLTNFHQPQSTLLALVSAFSSLKTVKACYQWAIERKFRLFSYGDLSCWVGTKR